MKVLIKNAGLKDAIVISGVLKYENIPYWFDTTNPLVERVNERKIDTDYELDLGMSDEELKEDILKTDNNRFLNPSQGLLPRCVLIAQLLFRDLKMKGENASFCGYYPFTYINSKLILTTKEFDWKKEKSEIRLVESKDLPNLIATERPWLVIDQVGSDAQFMIWGQYQGPKKAHLSPFFLSYEPQASDNICNWGNTYYVEDFTKLDIFVDHIEERIKYKNDYRLMIKENVKKNS